MCGSDCQILPDGQPHCHNNSGAQPRVSHTGVFIGYTVCVCFTLASLCMCIIYCVYVFFSVSSWASMFSVVPTICFGFQVGSYMRSITQNTLMSKGFIHPPIHPGQAVRLSEGQHIQTNNFSRSHPHPLTRISLDFQVI